MYYKGIPTQVLSCEYCEIFNNNYFEEHLPTAASVLLIIKLIIINIGHLPTSSSPKTKHGMVCTTKVHRSAQKKVFADC